MSRRRLLGLLLVLAVVVASLVTGFELNSRATAANSPAAQALYWRTLQRLAGQTRFRLDETFRAPVPVAYRENGLKTVTYHLLHVAPDRTEARSHAVGGAIYSTPFALVTVGRTFCLGASFSHAAWVCSPAHRIPIAQYVQDYLVGGEVDHLRYSRSIPPAISQGTAGRGVIVTVSGRGWPGCTPQGAGQGVNGRYQWCEPYWVPGNPQFTGMLTIDRATGLPLRFWLMGRNRFGASNESVSFSYGGRFAIRIPHAQRVPCLSWLPAVHCVELRPRR